MIDFDKQEIENIRDIIERYREVSSSLNESLDEAKKIQERVETLTNEMNSIKKEEDSLMETLHSKYGEFSLQNVYDILTDNGGF